MSLSRAVSSPLHVRSLVKRRFVREVTDDSPSPFPQLCERRISRISRLIRAASRAALSISSSHFLLESSSFAWPRRYEACITVSIALLRSCAKLRSLVTVSLCKLGHLPFRLRCLLLAARAKRTGRRTAAPAIFEFPSVHVSTVISLAARPSDVGLTQFPILVRR